MNPSDQLCERDAKRIVKGAIGADGHEGRIVLEARPRDFLPLDEVDAKTNAQRNFDGRACNLPVTLRRVSITHVKKAASDVYGQVNGEARPHLRCVHIPAEFGGDDRRARFSTGGRHAETSEKWLHRNPHREARVEGVKRCFIRGAIDVV